MKISEVANSLPTFTATVRVVTPYATVTVRTSLKADSMIAARAMLSRIYGASNVLSLAPVSAHAAIDEHANTLSPAQLQVKSMTDRAKQLNQQARQLRARQSMARAQQKLTAASQSTVEKSA